MKGQMVSSQMCVSKEEPREAIRDGLSESIRTLREANLSLDEINDILYGASPRNEENYTCDSSVNELTRYIVDLSYMVLRQINKIKGGL